MAIQERNEADQWEQGLPGATCPLSNWRLVRTPPLHREDVLPDRNKVIWGLPWWYSGYDLVLPLQGAQVPSLGVGLD